MNNQRPSQDYLYRDKTSRRWIEPLVCMAESGIRQTEPTRAMKRPFTGKGEGAERDFAARAGLQEAGWLDKEIRCVRDGLQMNLGIEMDTVAPML